MKSEEQGMTQILQLCSVSEAKNINIIALKRMLLSQISPRPFTYEILGE